MPKGIDATGWEARISGYGASWTNGPPFGKAAGPDMGLLKKELLSLDISAGGGKFEFCGLSNGKAEAALHRSGISAPSREGIPVTKFMLASICNMSDDMRIMFKHSALLQRDEKRSRKGKGREA